MHSSPDNAEAAVTRAIQQSRDVLRATLRSAGNTLLTAAADAAWEPPVIEMWATNSSLRREKH